jgi:hypothetical protein
MNSLQVQMSTCKQFFVLYMLIYVLLISMRNKAMPLHHFFYFTMLYVLMFRFAQASYYVEIAGPCLRICTLGLKLCTDFVNEISGCIISVEIHTLIFLNKIADYMTHATENNDFTC